MICEACGNIAACEPLENATICADCAPAFRSALDEARGSDAWGRARDAHVVARALLRERGGTTQLLLRDLPAPVVRAFKTRAAAEGVTVRELFLAAAENYLATASAPPPNDRMYISVVEMRSGCRGS